MARTRETGMEFCGSGITPTAQNSMTTAGAVSLTTYCTAVNTTTGSGHASTLANGSRVGQLKKVILVVDAGDLVLTVANMAGGNTITFADAGDWIVLQWNGAQWVPIAYAGAVDAGPAISTV